jgi:hypothetical protein
MFGFSNREYALLLICALLMVFIVFCIRRWIVKRARLGRTGKFRISGLALLFSGLTAVLFSSYILFDSWMDMRRPERTIFDILSEITFTPFIFFDLVLFLLGLAGISIGVFFIRYSRIASGGATS